MFRLFVGGAVAYVFCCVLCRVCFWRDVPNREEDGEKMEGSRVAEIIKERKRKRLERRNRLEM